MRIVTLLVSKHDNLKSPHLWAEENCPSYQGYEFPPSDPFVAFMNQVIGKGDTTFKCHYKFLNENDAVHFSLVWA